jgi:hypothetical protein
VRGAQENSNTKRQFTNNFQTQGSNDQNLLRPGLRFCSLVIAICLGFGAWDLKLGALAALDAA